MSRGLPSRVLISEGLIHASQRLLHQGRKVTEDVLYWAGVELASEWVLSSYIVPEAHTNRCGFMTTAAANARVVSYLAGHRLKLLALVHTHPDHRVDHSDGDDAGAFMAFDGFLSIVVPHYGQRGILPLTQCGIHRFECGRFWRLSTQTIEQIVEVLPSGVNLRRQVE